MFIETISWIHYCNKHKGPLRTIFFTYPVTTKKIDVRILHEINLEECLKFQKNNERSRHMDDIGKSSIIKLK